MGWFVVFKAAGLIFMSGTTHKPSGIEYSPLLGIHYVNCALMGEFTGIRKELPMLGNAQMYACTQGKDWPPRYWPPFF